MLSRLIQESETPRCMDNTNIREIRQLLSLNYYPCFDLIKMSLTIKETIKLRKKEKRKQVCPWQILLY